MATRLSVVRSCTSPVLPLPSYLLHFTPHRSTVNATRAIPPGIGRTVPRKGADPGRRWKVEGFWPQVAPRKPAGASTTPGRRTAILSRARNFRFKRKKTRWQRVFVQACPGQVVQSGALPCGPYGSPRRRSSQRSSRPLMNELRLPVFLPPAALALPAAELRIVAKYTPAPMTIKPRTPTKML